MPLSERTIESAIDRLKKSPGTFQRLVERYAYLTYPQQFKGLIPQGRNSSDVTVKGWPDIYSLSPSFMLDVVEVTHSPAWSRHLEEDLAKAEALGSGQLSGFLFVAWANEPSPLISKQKNPQHEQLVSYRKRLLALGIPPENINFVFKKQLVRALSQPRFANVVTGILELPSSCTPFRTISGNREIFGTSGLYDVFAPSREEYKNDLVHRAAITDEVEKRLNSQGWAWLRGRGAAGKTVLSIHLGLAYESRSLPAYYVDLSKTDVSVSEALDIITTHADDGVLFIVDNVHLNQAFARDCFDHWKSVAAGSHLLLIGRDTTNIALRGTALPLDDLKAEAQTLEVTQEDLEGVFLRLARRAPYSSDSIPNPPQDALQRWHRLFGGDLIAFSAAVAHRLKQMGQYDWTIEAQDATTYVQLAYLGKASEAERLNLLRLSVLAQLELDVPEEALELAKVEPFLQNGLVHSIGRGRDNRYGYYRLVHPGLGDLLLTAAGYSDKELKRFLSEQYAYIAYRNPSSGAHIAARLESGARVQEAALILTGIVESESGLEMLVTNGIQFLRVNTERLARLGVLSESEIDDKLAAISLELNEFALHASLQFSPAILEYAERKLPKLYTSLVTVLERPETARRLSESALQTPLDHIAVFLEYAEGKLPELYISLVAVFEQPESAKRLSESALQAPLRDLAVFLEYAEGKLPELYTSLVAVLERPESAKRLGESALQAPLGHLAFFLKYAEGKLPELYTSLVAVFEQPASARRLSESALLTPLDQIGFFLEYAEGKLPELYTSLVAVFEQPESAKRLSESALQTPLDHLSTFLEYAKGKLPIISEAITNKLAEPANINFLAETSCHSPLDSLLHFVQTAVFGAAVVHAIDKNKWDKCRLENMSGQLDSFPAAAKMFQYLGRPDLAEAPAIALIRGAEQKQWNSNSVGLHHLSHVMRLGRAAGEEVINNFITSIATPSWLKEKYENAPTYGIASALFSLWGYYEDAVLSHFNTGALKSRVRYELNYLSKMTPEQLLVALQLLGVSALIGARVGTINITWPNVDCVNDAVRLASPPSEATIISYVTIQLWLGLRVMAGIRAHQVYVQPELGERVLVIWKNSTGYTEKQNALNKSMISWMERCAKSGWMLIADRQKG